MVHKRKRDNLDAPTTWRVMLAAVPGMSPVKAEVVATAYPTMGALTSATTTELAALRVMGSSTSPPSTSVDLTTGEEETTGAKPGRRLGPAIAKRLVALI